MKIVDKDTFINRVIIIGDYVSKPFNWVRIVMSLIMVLFGWYCINDLCVGLMPFSIFWKAICFDIFILLTIWIAPILWNKLHDNYEHEEILQESNVLD